jgi:hypothetical protein
VRPTISLAAFAASLAALGTTAACAQLSGSVEPDFNSRYVWRGFAYSQGSVLQENVSLAAKGFTLSAWGNLVLTQEPQQGEINSTSVGLQYAREISGFRLEPMVEYWNLPIPGVKDPGTGEISLNVSHAAGPVRVFLLQVVDVVHFRGAYYGETGLSRNLKWKRSNTKANLRIGWANADFLRVYAEFPKPAFLETGGDISSTVTLSRHLYLRPHAEWTYLVDGRVRRAVQPASLWNAGIALGVMF